MLGRDYLTPLHSLHSFYVQYIWDVFFAGLCDHHVDSHPWVVLFCPLRSCLERLSLNSSICCHSLLLLARPVSDICSWFVAPPPAPPCPILIHTYPNHENFSSPSLPPWNPVLKPPPPPRFLCRSLLAEIVRFFGTSGREEGGKW